MSAFLDRILFSIGENDVRVLGVLLLVLYWAGLFVLFRLYCRFLRNPLERFIDLHDKEHSKLRRKVRTTFFLLAILGADLILNIRYSIPLSGETSVGVSQVLVALLILQLARIADTILSGILNRNYSHRRSSAGRSVLGSSTAAPSSSDDEDKPMSKNRTLQFIVYLLAIIFLIQAFGVDYVLGEINVGGENAVRLTISRILWGAIIFLLARLFIWMITNLFLYSYYKREKVNIGAQFAINQLLRYVIYAIAALFILQSIGLNLTVILGGAAALLIGVGIGLQQTFNDFFSGILLLFERSVEVGDVVEVDGLVGTVRRIGLRTSEVNTRRNITVIVPNSRLVTNSVTNWSYNDRKARFNVEVSVAYGSDTALVKKLLLQVARSHEKVLRFPTPFVRFTNFGDSGLYFELHFFSREFMTIEDVTSDLRFEIDQAFRDNGVTIPFPQRDLHFKTMPPQEAQLPHTKNDVHS